MTATRTAISRLPKLSTWLGFGSSTILPRQVGQVRAAERQCKGLSDHEILKQAKEICELSTDRKLAAPKQFIRMGGLIAESVFRSFGFRLHDVQVRAMLAGCQGAIVEMQTGEGKTVVTGATAALKSLTNPAVHVSTTNAYLAGRDLEELVPVFQRLGLSSSLLPEGNDVGGAQNAYEATITYGPGYQFGFDYLRDQVVLRENRQSRLGVQTLNAISGTELSHRLMQPPEYHAMLIDEADCVMIDEAATPLVISGSARVAEDPTPFKLAGRIAATLAQNTDFEIKLPEKRIELTDEAKQRCHDDIAHHRDLNLERPWRIYISNALRALHILKKEVDYVVLDGEVQIVDQYTGRIFSDRTWQDGLHQAVESKENVKIMSAPPTVARITRQRYLLMYDQLAGLTGTASAVTREFQNVYHCKVVSIPTNLPCIRTLLKPRFFRDQEAKLSAIAEDVAERHSKGQPVLLGTRTIDESLRLQETLVARGLDPVILNGLQDKDEAEIVAEAGKFGALTIATNMAGRGTDIKPDRRALDAGGLHVVGFSPNQSTRIDRQLVGRAARQGHAGSAQFFVSADEEILQTHAPSLGKKIASRSKAKGESAVSFARELLAVQQAIELKQYEVRQQLVQRDQWMDLVRESIEKE